MPYSVPPPLTSRRRNGSNTPVPVGPCVFDVQITPWVSVDDVPTGFDARSIGGNVGGGGGGCGLALAVPAPSRSNAAPRTIPLRIIRNLRGLFALNAGCAQTPPDFAATL